MDPRPDPWTRSLAAGAVGALIGAFGGALIGETLSAGPGALIGLLGGAALFGTGEGITERIRRPGLPKPHAWRIFGAVFFAAALGGAVELAAGEVNAIVFAVLLGLLVSVIGTVGLLSFRSNRIVLGLACGLAVGVVAQLLDDGTPLAIVAGAVALGYRLIGAVWFRGQDLVEVVGERISPEEAELVVPFEAKSRRDGA